MKTRDLVKSGKVIRKRRKQMRKVEQPSKNIAKESVRLEYVKKPVEKRVRMDEARKVDTIMRKMVILFLYYYYYCCCLSFILVYQFY